jgi:branched-chain amino acid transport system ATP-binding protein
MMLKISDLDVYYGYVHALKKISIEVKKGEIVALLGANGAGKTSVLKTISGIKELDGGKITLEDRDISHTMPDIRTKLGIVQSPEGRQVFAQMNVEDNLKAGAYTRKSFKNLDKDFEKIYSYFPRLEERKKQLAGTLSGGEQQMLSIGRALMANPKVLLLDEPSLGLAPLIVEDIFKIIKQINKEGTTVLLVEQNAYQALSIAHSGYVLETGKIVLSGSAEDLKSNKEVQKAYLGGE